MPRHVLTVGLSFGDEGKGTIVDALVRRHHVPLVVRYSGGAQCAHNVVTDAGLHHCFAQFGSGTLAGASTLLTRHVVVDPIRLVNEALVLQGKGVIDPFALIMVNRACLVITPFHRALNQLREMGRTYSKGGRHGSCGVGVGEAVSHSLSHPGHVLRVAHLGARDIVERLTHIRDGLLPEARRLSGWDTTDEDEVSPYAAFTDPNLIEAFAWRYQRFAEAAQVISDDQQAEMLRVQDAVWEGAQGVLLDQDYGFHPYTTWSTVTLRNAIVALADADLHDYETLGITRCYATRHGVGPLPTEDKAVLKAIKEPHNGRNAWQGAFRAGWFDLRLARYARSVAGRLDGLAITHLDQAARLGEIKVGVGYPCALKAPDPTDFGARTRLARRLMRVRPDQVHHSIAPSEGPALATCIGEALDLPVQVTSYGPTAAAKAFRP